MPTTLHVESDSGAEEYRLWEGGVEVRKLQGSADASSEREWRRLSRAELRAHVQDRTAVAQWLQHRIGWRRLLQACVDPETLEEFGIPELDRFAA